MTHTNVVLVTVAILGICHFSLQKSIARRDDFDIANCKHSPKFILDSVEPGEDVTAKLNSTHTRIFYFSKPTRISIECFARFPIEIQVEREMPSLVEHTRIERIVSDIFDNSTYCYRIRFYLPVDYKITGKYTCKGIIRQNQTSSIFIFSNGDKGPQLLNSGTTKTISGLPDDTGWITIPCIGTNLSSIPVLYKRPIRTRANLLEVTLNSDVTYDPTLGFLIKALSQGCCSQEYRCSLDSNISFLTVKLQKFRRRDFFRVPNMKSGDLSNIVLKGPQTIYVYCESNERVRLEYSSQVFHNSTPIMELNRKSFYKNRFSLSGYHAGGTLYIICNLQDTEIDLYTWEYSIQTDGAELPGIKYNPKNMEYPFTCRSVGLDVNIYNIQCDDHINCQIAERFSDLVTPNNSDRDKYPFKVTVGSRCSVQRHCAQIHDKTERKQGIIRCIESNPEQKIYSQNYIKGLNGQIIVDHDNITANEDEMVKIEKITRTIYFNETITFQCEASSAIFAMGIQLVFTLNDGSFLTANNLTFFEYNEDNRDGRITFKASVRIPHSDISGVACYAPFWNTKGWRTASQRLDVQMGECPSINPESQSEFKWSLSDMNKEIVCEAWGDPTPTITWTKDNDQLLSSKNKKITTQGNLSKIIFRQIEESNLGKYLCTATNVRGVALKSFEVRIDNSRELIIYGSVFGTVTTLFAVIVFVLVRKILKNRGGLSKEEIKFFFEGNPNYLEDKNMLSKIDGLPYDQTFEIPRSSFSWGNMLGKGAFGVVYKGTYSDQPVAIKTTCSVGNSGHSDVTVYVRSILSEIKVMISLAEASKDEHTGKANILNFIGANTKNISRGVFLLTEFCELGSLESYLRRHRENFVVNDPRIQTSIPMCTNDQRSNSAELMCSKDLTKWAYEISNGMEYIAKRNIFHGDLASRNVLLTSSRVSKIADFGLSRRIYEYSTYTKKNQEPLPWRWMAIESLKDLIFSSQSDVWSYGITLWEIFSLAEVPYPGLSWTIDFVDTLENGTRPAQPKYASAEIFAVMKQTWLINPPDRYTFEQIRVAMSSILEKYTEQSYIGVISGAPGEPTVSKNQVVVA